MARQRITVSTSASSSWSGLMWRLRSGLIGVSAKRTERSVRQSVAAAQPPRIQREQCKDSIDKIDIDQHLGKKPSEGTKRYKAARTKAPTARRAKAAHSDLSREIDSHVERKQATLAQVRQAVGLTQTQLAEELGIAQGDVSKIERRDNLRLATLARFNRGHRRPPSHRRRLRRHRSRPRHR